MAAISPTVLGAAKGYIPAGTVRWVFCPTVADMSVGATNVEVSAGTDLTNLFNSASGWDATADDVDFPNAGSTWKGTIPGMSSASDSSLVLNRDLAGDDARDLFDDGTSVGTTRTSGFMWVAYEGAVEGGETRTFAVIVKSVSTSVDPAAATLDTIGFSIYAPPSPRGTYSAI